MLLLRHKALHMFEKIIVDGKSTKNWYDPWINGGNLLNKLGIQSMATLEGDNLIVYRIISNSKMGML